MPRTLLSLFDHSGVWSAPFRAAGWTVVQVDIKDGGDVRRLDAEALLREHGAIDGLLAAPPCTDFTRSGAAHWKAKDRDGRTAASVELVEATMRLVRALSPAFWALENPVGRLARMVPAVGQWGLIFDPCDYAGWTSPTEEELARLDEMRARAPSKALFSTEDVELVKRVGAYTKKTCLWGSFNLPEKRRIEPVHTSSQGSWLMALGGKSEATKAARSDTPVGFASAFFEVNQHWRQHAATG